MKQAAMVLALFFLIASTSHSQKHAPTAEQCQADALLWSSNPKEQLVKPGVSELSERAQEMSDCAKADPTGPVNYSMQAGIYNTAITIRMQHFMARHHLYSQFLKEDKEGLR